MQRLHELREAAKTGGLFFCSWSARASTGQVRFKHLNIFPPCSISAVNCFRLWACNPVMPNSPLIASNGYTCRLERPMSKPEAEARNTAVSDSSSCWPALPLQALQQTRDTLHMWTQIVGKVRLELTPRTNHWWNVALHVTARGLTTSVIPYGERVFEIEFDFLEHQLIIKTCDPATKVIPLGPRSVADFYREFMSALRALKIDVKIWHMPVEVMDPIPFDQHRVHARYDKEYVRRFWRGAGSIDEVFKGFRSRSVGKSSPVHFFWGSFDLAVTRFSGRPAPPRPDADPITREASSHEGISL